MTQRDAEPGKDPAGRRPAGRRARSTAGTPRSAAALVALLLAAVVLLGWNGDSPSLAHLGTGTPAMPPLTAVALAAIAMATLLGRVRSWRPLAVFLGVLALIITGAAFVEWGFALDLGVDDRIAPAALAAAGSSGRPSPHAAIVFFLLALAVALPRRAELAAELAAALAGLISLTVLAALAMRSHAVTEIDAKTGMSLAAVLGGLLLAGALVDPRDGPLRRAPHGFTYLAGTVGVTLTIVVVLVAAHEARHDADRQQQGDLRLAVSATENATAPVIAAIDELSTLYVPTGKISASQFRRAAGKVMRRPVLAAVTALERVPGSERARFEREVGPILQRVPGGEPVPASRRAVYTVIRESLSRTGQSNDHLDLGVDPGRGPVIRRALRTWRPVVSAPLTSVRTGRPVVGIFVPVAARDGAREDVVVAGFFDVQALSRQIAGALPPSLDLRITDGPTALAGSAKPFAPGALGARVAVADRRWTVTVAAATPERDRILAGAGIGLGLTLLLICSVGTLVRRELSARARADRGARERDAAAALAVRARRRSRFLEENATDVLFLMGQDGSLTYASPAARTLLDLAPEQLLGQTITEIGHPDDHERMQAVFSSLDDVDGVVEITHRVRHGQGHWIWVETLVRAVRDPRTGAFVEAQGSVRDITRKREVEHRLREAESRFRSAFSEAPLGMAVIGLDGSVLQVNRALEELAGQDGPSIRGMVFDTLLHQADADTHRDGREALLAGDLTAHEAELRIVRPSGQIVWAGVTTALVHDVDDAPQRFLAQVQDVSARRRAEAQLPHLADHDPLTGVLNRRAFERSLREHLARVRRYGPDGAVLVVNVDATASRNERLGRSGGDDTIVAVARALRARLRESDLLARFGGDEFAILLPRATLDEALAVGSELVDAVGEVTVAGEEAGGVTVSVGVALVDRPERRGSELLIDADLAMYDAKEAGRNRVHAAQPTPAPRPRARSAADPGAVLREAIDEQRLVLYAEPVVDLGTERVRTLELLLRLRSPDGDLQSPASFMDVAERHGLVQRLDLWTLEQAVQVLAANPDGPSVSVNVSIRSLHDDAVVDLLGEALTEHRVDARRLGLEIDEREAVTHLPRLKELARDLEHLGCTLAIDGFGAGFGSFYTLKRLPFDVLKIDGEFTRHCASEHEDQVVIGAIVEMARARGAQTVAARVDDDATARTLWNLGVDGAQGLVFGAPMPVQDALASARARRPASEGESG